MSSASPWSLGLGGLVSDTGTLENAMLGQRVLAVARVAVIRFHGAMIGLGA